MRSRDVCRAPHCDNKRQTVRDGLCLRCHQFVIRHRRYLDETPVHQKNLVRKLWLIEYAVKSPKPKRGHLSADEIRQLKNRDQDEGFE